MTRIETDNHGRPTVVADPSAGTRKLTYDAFGQLVEQADATGTVMKSTFDKLGRLVSRSDTEGDVSLVWDSAANGVGKIASASRGPSGATHHEKYGYDSYSRLVRLDTLVGQADVGATVQFTRQREYDSAGNLSAEKWATPETSFAVAYTRDANGHLVAIKDSSEGLELWRAQQANAAGQLTHEKFLSGYETVTQFHPLRGWVTGVATKPVQDLEFAHDARGNVVRRVDRTAKLAQRFVYNSEQELEQVWLCSTDSAPCPGEVLQRNYAYDSIGNMVWDNELGDHLYDQQRPQLMVKAGGDAYEYDSNGYTTLLRGKRVEYTAFAKLKKVTAGNVVTELRYDAHDRRALKIDGTSRTAYVGPLQRVRAGTSVTTQLQLHAYGRVVAAITVTAGKPVYSFFHPDNLGSANVTSRYAFGAVGFEPQYAFEPFGQTQSPSWSAAYVPSLAPPMESAGFTGHDHDAELGLIDMGGRVYDPKIARFLTPDPIVRAPFKRQDLNRYSYAWNNPLRVTDPTGYTEDWGDEQSYDDYDDLDEADMSMDEGPDDEISYGEDGTQNHSFGEAFVEGQPSVYGSPTDQSVAQAAPEGPNPDDFPDDPDDGKGQSIECPVELCSRAADLPLGAQMAKVHLYHRWIRTPNVEVGMGKEGGGVPGREINTNTMQTAMNDHKGEGDKPGSICVPICGVSVEDIEGRIAEGTPTGMWLPLLNDCNNVVEDKLVESGADPATVDMPLHPTFFRDVYLWLSSESE